MTSAPRWNGRAAFPLKIVDRLAADPRLAQYQRRPSVRGDLLEKLGRRAEARVAFERAAALAGNAREQALLRARAAACD